MTDRNLLEAAADAAGHNWRDWCKDETAAARAPEMNWPYEWNPLLSSGDAFDLAIQMGLSIEVLHDSSQPMPWVRVTHSNRCWLEHVFTREFAADPLAATRRAIVVMAGRTKQ